MASASAGVSAPSRAARGAMTRSRKIAAFAARWPTGSNSSSAKTSGRVGVVAEPALRWPDPGHDRLACLAVGAAGAADREPVQRPVGAQVGVVAAVQLRAQLGDLRGVVGGRGLGVEQRPRGVPQLRAAARSSGGLAAGDLVRPLGAVDDPGERAVGVGPDKAVGLLRADQAGLGRRPFRPGAGAVQVSRADPGASPRWSPGRWASSACGVAGGADDQVVGPVGAVGGGELAEHGLRVGQEVLVDRDLRAVEFGEPGLFPRGVAGLTAGFAAAEDQQVGHDLVPAARWWAPLGSRIAPTRSAREAISRRAAGLRASMVYREVSTITRPPGRVRASDLTRKWLWMACPDGVVPSVVQDRLPERDVPDHQVVGAVGITGGGERLGADLGLRVQRRRDSRRHRVELDAGDLRRLRGRGR